jgi:2-polyprenyl-6-hydroxyphenyl methylase/3-demethylubiquinone-9 3-methyltransferase
MTPNLEPVGSPEQSNWDHGSHKDFFNYYAEASETAATEQRFRSIQKAVLRVATQNGMRESLDVLDVGCGAGTQARMWAELGHRVHALDVNEPLIQLAKQRAREKSVNVVFEVGTATSLPWTDASMDVCLMPELLEHVTDWQACLREASRVLRPGGLLYLSTTNGLCPIQQEFNLPLYSWYPRPIKRHCERLAVTTRPEIANYAKYPAVHWFSFYGLQRHLGTLGLSCLDRFDLIDRAAKPAHTRFVISLLRTFRLARFLGHVATPGTFLIAVKHSRPWNP